LPRVTERLVGDAESEKFGTGAAFTVRPTVVVWVSPPEMPVMVTVTVPVAAVLLAVNVRRLVLVAGFVPNAAVTPEGSPVALSVTLPVNPFAGVTLIVLVPPVPPWVIVPLAGDADRPKFGVTGAFTVNETVVVCVKLPEMPVMVTLTVPVVAVLLAVNVSRLVLVAGFVPKAAVTPEGSPEALSVTLPLKPLVGFIAIVLVLPAPPCVTVTLDGDGNKLKFGVVDTGQLLTRFVTFTVPMPVAKSQPVEVPYPGP
jgi:hypothetical protein